MLPSFVAAKTAGVMMTPFLLVLWSTSLGFGGLQKLSRYEGRLSSDDRGLLVRTESINNKITFLIQPHEFGTAPTKFVTF